MDPHLISDWVNWGHRSSLGGLLLLLLPPPLRAHAVAVLAIGAAVHAQGAILDGDLCVPLLNRILQGAPDEELGGTERLGTGAINSCQSAARHQVRWLHNSDPAQSTEVQELASYDEATNSVGIE